jgi:alginate O-acetyltransferase complex protein AlgI
MWTLAVSLFFAGKFLAWRAASSAARPSPAHTLGYFLLWPGMDPQPFAFPTAHPQSAPAPVSAWLRAFGKTLAGASLLLWAAWLPASLLAGWIGMVGLVLFLHFGLFALLRLGWLRKGILVPPIMRAPMLADSLADFWGARWNTAFSRLAREFIVRPLTPRLGIARTVMLVYLVSGVVHETVISVPAGAGFGLPTAYFLLQGLATLFERSVPGRRLGLGRGVCGRIFAVATVAAPAFWLFHPAFVQNVFLPMLRVLRIP